MFHLYESASASADNVKDSALMSSVGEPLVRVEYDEFSKLSPVLKNSVQHVAEGMHAAAHAVNTHANHREYTVSIHVC